MATVHVHILPLLARRAVHAIKVVPTRVPSQPAVEPPPRSAHPLACSPGWVHALPEAALLRVTARVPLAFERLAGSLSWTGARTVGPKAAYLQSRLPLVPGSRLRAAARLTGVAELGRHARVLRPQVDGCAFLDHPAGVGTQQGQDSSVRARGKGPSSPVARHRVGRRERSRRGDEGRRYCCCVVERRGGTWREGEKRSEGAESTRTRVTIGRIISRLLEHTHPRQVARKWGLGPRKSYANPNSLPYSLEGRGCTNSTATLTDGVAECSFLDWGKGRADCS